MGAHEALQCPRRAPSSGLRSQQRCRTAFLHAADAKLVARFGRNDRRRLGDIDRVPGASGLKPPASSNRLLGAAATRLQPGYRPWSGEAR